LPIAVIDFFDVTIVPNFCHEIYLRFSALGGMPGRTSWWLKSPFLVKAISPIYQPIGLNLNILYLLLDVC
jgi:hypothetical protein